jgi:RNA polymerase sigma factor (sigma-70 family)
MDSQTTLQHALDNAPRYTRDEEIALWRSMRRGSKSARQKLFASCIPWAVSRATYFYAKYRGRPYSLELEDATQEALRGLLYSLNKFNAKKSRLTSYSTWWIWQYMMRALQNNSAIHLPPKVIEQKRKWQNAQHELPSGLRTVISLDDPLPDCDGGVTFNLSGVAAYTDPSLTRDILEAETLHAKMRFLPERQREILYRRYWLGETLDEIAVSYRFTRERARQIQNQALAKLRELYCLS